MPADPIQRHHVHRLGEQGPPLVFAHGLGTDQRAWRFVAPAFAASHRVVLFDHVGFGGSDALAYSASRHASLDGHATDLIELVDALGLGPVSYVGHSAGASIGMLAAERAPDRFVRLVLVGASPRFVDDPPHYRGGFARHEIDALLDALDADQQRFASGMAPLAMGEDGGPELVEDFGRTLRQLDPLVARRFGRLAFLLDIRESVRALDLSALVLQCTRDSIVPREVGRWFQAHLRGSRLVEIEGSGHCPHLSHSQATREAIAAWLREQEGGA